MSQGGLTEYPQLKHIEPSTGAHAIRLVSHSFLLCRVSSLDMEEWIVVFYLLRYLQNGLLFNVWKGQNLLSQTLSSQLSV